MVFLSGCFQGNNNGNNNSPTPIPTMGKLCSKNGYKTEKNNDGFVTLNDKSMDKLAENNYDLREISGLSCIELLDLADTPVADIEPLKELKKLKILDLSFTAINDISDLKKSTTIERLGLAYTDVSNISSIKSLENLRFLNLRESPVSSVSRLKDLPRLEYVDLRGTNVSILDCKTLQQELPNAKVLCPDPETEGVKNCGYDRKCFATEFKKCRKAKLTERTKGLVFHYEIIGSSDEGEDLCVLEMKYLSHPSDLWLGKKMQCVYNSQQEFETAIKDYSTCTGPLVKLLTS